MYRHWIAYYIKSTLDRIPVLYLMVLRFKHRGSGFLQRIIAIDSDVCIEGHNRSANSFAVKAFRCANDTDQKKYKIATHVHASSQVLKAIDLGVPTLVLIRKPEDAVVSQKSLAIQLEQVANPEGYPLEICLSMYVDFYQRLLSRRDKVLIVRFEEATTDFTAVITQFNTRFGTSYKAIEHTEGGKANIFKNSRVHLSPSIERDKIKKSLSKELKALQDSKIMEDARLVYRRFLEQ